MANVLIVAYLLIVLALVTVILLQRSEGGGLGMGSSANGFMSVRGTANVLTRTTGILAALVFFFLLVWEGKRERPAVRRAFHRIRL